MAYLIPAAVVAAIGAGSSLTRSLKKYRVKGPSQRIPLELDLSDMPNTRKRKAENQGGRLQKRANRGNSSLAVQTQHIPIAGGVIVSRPRVPRLMSTMNSTVVTNTEVVVNMTMSAAGAFSTFNLAMIPGLPTWLTGLSDLYSKWRWRSIEVIYIPSCPTTTQGKICMALGYDRLDAAPTSAANLSQNYRAITFPPYAGYDGASALSGNDTSAAIAVKADPNRFDKPWYPTIANAVFGPLAGNLQNQYCPVTVFVASEGGPVAATVVGDLYFKYTCEFIEPINPTMNV